MFEVQINTKGPAPGFGTVHVQGSRPPRTQAERWQLVRAATKRMNKRKYEVRDVPLSDEDWSGNHWTLAELVKRGQAGETYLIRAYRRGGWGVDDWEICDIDAEVTF